MNFLSIEIPDNFFDAEVRCGHYVSAEMKKIWAINLDLLHQVQVVCEKYGIEYFAGGGTLLGAVRHQGFIPWDDDIDLFMKRSEYERFVKIARSGVFKEPYFWLDHITDQGYLGEAGKLQNCNTTAIGPGYMRDSNGVVTQHLGIFLDVFPLDNIPDGENEQVEWKSKISKMAQKAWDLRKYSSRKLLQDRTDLEWLDFYFKLKGNTNELFEQYYKLLSANADEQTLKCCIYSFYCRNIGHWVYDRADWSNPEQMPFEMMSVPVPAKYDEILTQTYGDWHKMVKGASVHEQQNNGLIFDTENPYTMYVDPVTGIKKELVLELRDRQIKHER